MTHPERVYTRTQLLDHVWGGSVYVEERTIDVHIRRLRKTLEPFGLENMVQTVRGSGYRFLRRPDVPQSHPATVRPGGCLPDASW